MSFSFVLCEMLKIMYGNIIMPVPFISYPKFYSDRKSNKNRPNYVMCTEHSTWLKLYENTFKRKFNISEINNYINAFSINLFLSY